MKSLYILLSLGLLLPVLAEAQNPATQSSTTKPKSTTSSTTSRPSVRPPATRAAESNASVSPTSAKPNRQQELYDQYHGVTKKPTPPPPVSVASEPAPIPQATRPEPVVASSPDNTLLDNQNAAIRIGIRAGVTYPFYFEKMAGLDPVVGFVGGVVAQFGRGTFSFQPEVNYSRVNTKQISGFGTFNGSANQFVVPLFLKISSGTFDGNRFFLNVGPYGSYLSSINVNGVKQAIDNTIGRVSFGAAAGAGALLKAGPGHVTVEIRGSYRLGDNVNGFSTDSRTILGEGTIGYIFPLGR